MSYTHFRTWVSCPRTCMRIQIHFVTFHIIRALKHIILHAPVYSVFQKAPRTILKYRRDFTCINIYIYITFKTCLQEDGQTTVTDDVGVVGAASPCGAVGRRPSRHRLQRRRRRAISRSGRTGGMHALFGCAFARRPSTAIAARLSRRHRLTHRRGYFSRTSPACCGARRRRHGVRGG